MTRNITPTTANNGNATTPQGRRRTTAGGGITARRRSCPACAARCRRDGGSRIDRHAWRSACRTLGSPSYFFHPCAGARIRVPFAYNRAYRCVRHCHRKPPRRRVRAIAGNSPAYSRDATRIQLDACLGPIRRITRHRSASATRPSSSAASATHGPSAISTITRAIRRSAAASKHLPGSAFRTVGRR